MSTTNNAVNAPFPLSPSQGGTGIDAPTAHGIMIGEGSSTMNTLVLTAGQIPIGTTSSDPTGATLTAGTNIGITSSSGSITINATGAASFAWNTQSGTSVTMSPTNGYNVTSSSLCTLTLPSTCAQYSTFRVCGNGAGGWKIGQATGQTIQYGSGNSTTSGTGGSLASTNEYDQVELLCTVANTNFVVLNSIGNLTIT